MTVSPLPQPNGLQDLLKQAIVAHLQGQLGLAEDLYRSVLQQDQSNPVLYANLGTLCLSTGRPSEAIALLQQSLTLKPDYALAYNSLGIAWQQQKDGQQALTCYQQALALQPNYPDAWNNLGNLFHQSGQWQKAIEAFKRALQYKQDYPEAWFNLGNSLQALNLTAEAISAYHTVLKLQPQSHLALNNLGILQQQRGNFIAAEQCYHQALEACPDFLEAHRNLAQLLSRSQQTEAAIETYQKLIQAFSRRDHEFRGSPAYIETFNQLGVLLEEDGRYEEAIDCYRQALEQDPQNPDLHYNLGNVLQKEALQCQGDLTPAIAAYRQCLEYAPQFGEAWNNLGNTLKHQGDFSGAIDAYKTAVALSPDQADAWNNLGNVYHRQGQLAAASDCYHRALYLAFDHGDAQFNLSLLLLTTGQFHSGWCAYEYRFRKQTPIPLFPPPGIDRWDQSCRDAFFKGEGTLFLVSEQGLGDTLQFIRYGLELKKLGIQSLVALVPPRLVQLLTTCPGYDRVVAAGTDLPTDLPQPYRWMPLLSVPQLCGTTVETIPAPSPYLYASADRVEQWQERIRSLPGLKIGLCWQGNEDTEQENLAGRSCPLEHFAPLAQRPEISLVSLQKGSGEAALQEVSFRERITHWSDLDQEHAFVDTAAIVSQLDLVITIDTAMAHLAGALGQTVWVLLHAVPDWRWLEERCDSPWYPTLRLFRQTEAGNWQTVIAEVGTALTQTFNPASTPKMPQIPVSVGELLDKISILQIKYRQVQQPRQRQWIKRELQELNRSLSQLQLPKATVQEHLGALQKINQVLWSLENQIRSLIKAQEEGPPFIQVAQTICRYNDRRSLLKRKINEVYNSKLKEIKVYAEKE